MVLLDDGRPGGVLPRSALGERAHGSRPRGQGRAAGSIDQRPATTSSTNSSCRTSTPRSSSNASVFAARALATATSKSAPASSTRPSSPSSTRASTAARCCAGKWSPGIHEPLVSEEEWQRAHRGTAKGVRRSSDPLSGRVICGLCNRKMVVAQNGKGHLTYQCHHRGQGCDQPSRSNLGLARAAVKGLRLVGHDEGLREAIRRRLAGGEPDAAGTPRRTRRAAPATTLKNLNDERRQTPRPLLRGEDQRRRLPRGRDAHRNFHRGSSAADG